MLTRPERTLAGYRIYDEAVLNRLRFIKKAQALGFSLDEVRRILSLRKQGQSACRSVIAKAEAALSETEQKPREMQRFADALRTNLARWWKASPDSREAVADFCALIKSSEVPERS